MKTRDGLSGKRGCVFCGIVAGTEPAEMVWKWDDAIAFTPLNPVTPGHTLVVPRVHVADATVNLAVTAAMMVHASALALGYEATNILTSVGAAATQSVFHLHIHMIPRFVGDQLMVPWGTTGDPRLPHRCKGMDRLEAELRKRDTGYDEMLGVLGLEDTNEGASRFGGVS